MEHTISRLPADLAAARTRLEKWRSSGRPKRPLPREMWEMAADLVPSHGVYRVSRALRLEYYKVKEQAEDRQARKRTKRSAKRKPVFVEVAGPPSPPVVDPCLGCTVEVTDPSGRRITIRSPAAVDAAGLVAAFCGATR